MALLFGIGDLTFHTKATALDGDGVGVMQEPVENGGSESGIVVKDAGPSYVGLVGRQNDRSLLVSLTNDLEKEIGSGFVDGKVSKFVHDQDRRGEVFSESPFELMGRVRGGKCIDDIHSRTEEN